MKPFVTNRRRFLTTAAATGVFGVFGALGRRGDASEFTLSPSGLEMEHDMTSTVAAADATAVRPFHINFPESNIADLRRRVAATRWPERETVTDASQGVPLAMMQELAHYWGSDYNWRKCEAKLNALPNFMTEVDGLDIHFIHVRSRHENAMPLIITHGWPGSIIEQLKIIEPLTNPTAYGASASDAFHLVIPSIPGYGFSSKPTTLGWGPVRTARAWVELMKRLGYTSFAAQGGDIGGIITNVMATLAPPELLGIHTNFAQTLPPDVAKAMACGDPAPPGLSEEERRAYDILKEFRTKHYAYALEMGTRPQTLYGFADSPVDLAAWNLDHGDAWGQPAASIVSAVVGHTVDGHPAGAVTRDDFLDNTTLYWLTNTGVSAARFYWEILATGMTSTELNISIPAAVTIFPGEIVQTPRAWAERAYHKLIYYHRADKGGHFAAWEQPQLFSEEVRAGLRPLRK